MIQSGNARGQRNRTPERKGISNSALQIAVFLAVVLRPDGQRHRRHHRGCLRGRHRRHRRRRRRGETRGPRAPAQSRRRRHVLGGVIRAVQRRRRRTRQRRAPLQCHGSKTSADGSETRNAASRTSTAITASATRWPSVESCETTERVEWSGQGDHCNVTGPSQMPRARAPKARGGTNIANTSSAKEMPNERRKPRDHQVMS